MRARLSACLAMGGAVMKEVESNVTGIDPITIRCDELSSLRLLSSQEEESRCW
jgi:hypothetical protein